MFDKCLFSILYTFLKENILFIWFDCKSWNMFRVVHSIIIIINEMLKKWFKKTLSTEISGFWPLLSNDSYTDEKLKFLADYKIISHGKHLDIVYRYKITIRKSGKRRCTASTSKTVKVSTYFLVLCGVMVQSNWSYYVGFRGFKRSGFHYLPILKLKLKAKRSFNT